MSALHISLAAEPIAHLGSLPITNAMLTSLIGTVVICTLVLTAARRVTVHPRSIAGQAIEAGIEALLDLIMKVTGDRTRALSYFPLLATLFLFIIVNNWLGLLPGVGSITVTTDHGVVPLLRGATADLNTTFALAIISVGLTHVYALRRLGVVAHLKKYLSLNPIMLFVGLLELVAEASKMMSFSFRLFGNIFAGEILLVVISFLLPLAAPLPFFFLELFVGFIQALVFTSLPLVFLEIVGAEHGEGNQAHARAPATT